MDTYSFSAWEYFPDAQLRSTRYRYQGSESSGWEVLRNDRPYLHLGPGYAAVASHYCGICATDLNRHHLPFPLPQVTGHELVAQFHERSVAVEINASHWHRRQDTAACWYCRHGYANHCPQRLTLGIDRLPGGFAPWVLAPVGALHELSASWSPAGGILLEPLAAAQRAVDMTPPLAGDRVAVLGCGRLGTLLVAALTAIRERSGTDFSVCALAHRPDHRGLLRDLGANEIFVTGDGRNTGKFDIVYDTSGSGAGCEQALQLAQRCVHIKSTANQRISGMQHLTSLVINEYQLCGAHLMPAVGASQPVGTPTEPAAVLDFPDLAAVDEFLAAKALPGTNVLRPGGMMRITSPDTQTILGKSLDRGLQIHGSRCGDFAQTIRLMQDVPRVLEILQSRVICNVIPVAQLPEAFDTARRPGSLKIAVQHDRPQRAV